MNKEMTFNEYKEYIYQSGKLYWEKLSAQERRDLCLLYYKDNVHDDDIYDVFTETSDAEGYKQTIISLLFDNEHAKMKSMLIRSVLGVYRCEVENNFDAGGIEYASNFYLSNNQKIKESVEVIFKS